MAKKKESAEVTYDEARNRQKVPVGLRLNAETHERIRNAVFWLGQGLTIAGIVEEATEKAIAELERQHNGGKPFKERTGEIAKSKNKGK